MKAQTRTALAALLLLAPVPFSAGAVQAKKAPPTPATATAPRPAEADWRPVDPENVLVIDTTKGRVLVEMAPAVAPESVARIKILARQHFYDGLKFHRVMNNFMAQTGDPKGTGAGGSTLPDLKAEFRFRRDGAVGFIPLAKTPDGVSGLIGSLPVVTQPDGQMMVTADHKVWAAGLFCQGVAGMARASNPDSANSQFYLMRDTDHGLDGQYTAWGRVISGLDVVRNLAVGEPPPIPDLMTRVQVLADMPAGARPGVREIDPSSSSFKALVSWARAANGGEVSVCDFAVPVEVKP